MLFLIQSIAVVGVGVAVFARSCGAPPAQPSDAPIAAPPDAGGSGLDAPAPRCADKGACEAACNLDGGTAGIDACVRLADLTRSSHSGVMRDRLGARDRYRNICLRTDDPLACTRLALSAGLLQDLDLAPDWLVPERAPLGMLAAACESPGTRGELACAALVLLKSDASLAPNGRHRLCSPSDDPVVCAAQIALSACQDEGDPEACYLAAKGSPITSVAATERLRRECDAVPRDYAACLYRYALHPTLEAGALSQACPEREVEQPASIAVACLARARTEPRAVELAEMACKVGACQDPKRKRPIVLKRAALQASCDQGHVNGCANLIYTERADPTKWPLIRDRIAARTPNLPKDVAGASAVETSCYLGSIEGCQAAIAKLVSGNDAAKRRANELNAFLVRLADPLAAR